MSDLRESATTTKAPSEALSKISKDDLTRLLALRHHDPHSILGAHVTPRGVIVRAFRPGAESVSLLIEGEPSRPMRARPEPGLFESRLTTSVKCFRIASRCIFPVAEW